MLMGGLADMEVKAEVGEHEVVGIHLGDEAAVDIDAIPDKQFKGHVVAVGKNAQIKNAGTDAEVTTFFVRVGLDQPPEGGLPGMSSAVSIATATHDNVMMVPIQAVTSREAKKNEKKAAPREGVLTASTAQAATAAPAAPGLADPPTKASTGKPKPVKVVFVVDKDGVAQMREVHTGIASRTDVEVLDGVAEGETVVDGPYRTLARELQDGQKVKAGRSRRRGATSRALRAAVANAASYGRENSRMALIELDHIVKTYDLGLSKVPALRDVHFSHRAGRVRRHRRAVGLGQVDADEHPRLPRRAHLGPLPLSGRDVSALADDELADVRNLEIGFVFQSFQLLPRASALENVELPLIYRGSRSRSGASAPSRRSSACGLDDRMKHKPTELSGGQRQRVAIARALVTEPSLLLADEPTGNLDSRTGEEIVGLFLELHRKGNTIVLVTHEPKLAARCPRAVRHRRRPGHRRRPRRARWPWPTPRRMGAEAVAAGAGRAGRTPEARAVKRSHRPPAAWCASSPSCATPSCRRRARWSRTSSAPRSPSPASRSASWP